MSCNNLDPAACNCVYHIAALREKLANAEKRAERVECANCSTLATRVQGFKSLLDQAQEELTEVEKRVELARCLLNEWMNRRSQPCVCTESRQCVECGTGDFLRPPKECAEKAESYGHGCGEPTCGGPEDHPESPKKGTENCSHGRLSDPAPIHALNITHHPSCCHYENPNPLGMCTCKDTDFRVESQKD